MGKKREDLSAKIIEDDFTIHYNDYRGTYVVDKPIPKRENNPRENIPTVVAYGDTLPAVWELGLIACHDHGIEVPTHYDRKGDPPSLEIKFTGKVSNPFNEPRISRAFPGGPEELEIYDHEVVEGIHNHWIDPKSGKWTYTYNERMFEYIPSENLKGIDRGFLVSQKKLREILSQTESVEVIKQALESGQLYIPPFNQIETAVVNDLVRDRTSKGAQITTWMPTADPGLEGNRPCLQRLWFRLLGNFLNMNTYFRSRDSEAWYMNTYALSKLQRKVAGLLSLAMDEPILVSSYDDTSDSFHIYGRRRQWAEDNVRRMKTEHINKRLYTSNDPRVLEWQEEVKKNLAKDPDHYAKAGAH